MAENKKPTDNNPNLLEIKKNMEKEIPLMFNLASNPNTPEEILLEIFKKLESYKHYRKKYNGPIRFSLIEIALLENPNTPAEVLAGLANDPKLAKRTMCYIARHKNTPPNVLNKLAKNAKKEVEEKLKEASDPNTPIERLKKLAEEDENYSVLNTIINNENAPKEIKELAKKRKKELREKVRKGRRKQDEIAVRIALAHNENIDVETIRNYLSKDPEAAVKLALTENPKTPPDVLTKIKKYAIKATIKNSNNKKDLKEYEDILKGVALHNNTRPEDLEELAKYPNDVVKGRVLVNLLNRKILEDIVAELEKDESLRLVNLLNRKIRENNIVAELEKDESLKYFGMVVRSIISHDKTLGKVIEEVKKVGKSNKVMKLVEYCLLPDNNIQLKLEEYEDFVKFNGGRLNEALSRSPKTPVEILEELANKKSKTIRVLLAGNSKTPPEVLKELVEQPEIEIKINVSKNENTPSEALTKLKNYSIEAIKKSKNKKNLEKNIEILEGVAKHKNTSTKDLRDLLANILNTEMISTIINNINMPQEDLEALANFLNKENKEMISTIISNINMPQEDLEALANFLNKEMISTTISNINISQEDFENMTKKIRLNVARNLNTSSEDLEKLEFDNDPEVRKAASTTIKKRSRIPEAYNYFSLLRQD